MRISVTEMKEKNEKEGKSTERNTKHPASEDYWERKIRKYGDLKNKKLQDKEHTQRSKSLRSGVASTIASLTGIGTAVVSMAYHFGVVDLQGQNLCGQAARTEDFSSSQ
jgi:hypothetical protein